MKCRVPNLVWLGAGLAVAFWLIESLLHTFVFDSGSFAITLLGENDPNEVWMRALISIMFVTFGWIAEYAVRTERLQKEGAQRLNRLLRFLDYVLQSVRRRTEQHGNPTASLPGPAAVSPDSAGAASSKEGTSGEALSIVDLALSEDDVRMLTRFLQELSSFLDVRFKELYALLELMHEINMGLLFDQVLERAYETLRLVLPYNRLSVALIDDDGLTARARWARSDNPDMKLRQGYAGSLEGSSLRGIIASGEPRIINDLPAYLETHPDSASTQMMVAEGIHSSLTCPLISMGKPIGFMFFSSRESDTYKDAHIDIFKLIAGHLSVVLEKSHLYQQILQEKEKSDRLLLNVVPARIAARLRAGEQPVVENFPEVNILFADIVSFTAFAGRYPPERVVDFLQNIFVEMDRLCDQCGVEKIKTIGDEYMVISGSSAGAGDKNLRDLAQFALAVLKLVEGMQYPDGSQVRLRIGMHTGRAVAGVIGQRKFAYDIWGDAVNIASRMESCGVAGRIHVSEDTYSRLHNGFAFEERGTIDVKGKGPMKTYFLMTKK